MIILASPAIKKIIKKKMEKRIAALKASECSQENKIYIDVYPSRLHVNWFCANEAKSNVLLLISLQFGCVNVENTTLGPLDGADYPSKYVCFSAPSSGHNVLFSTFTHSNCMIITKKHSVLSYLHKTNFHAVSMTKQ